ncbi:DUF309 domain-containing protein [Alkalihalobacillus sp. LMS6]|uniref:DUF309 domain-containing protein n=1 Tax=Bacillaceae TaxID=186817 RepID=UPI000C07C869|nr:MULTISPECIES: DUF309 domain-containing protein [Bacillaceae]UTR04618.1 DUF309 domain-containing protein [Alkalihalobacillus sp. LMS6]
MYPSNYLAFLHYFHVDRDYFECHEVLEHEWKKQPDPDRLSPYVVLIQTAVALYHERRGNEKGAKILFHRVLTRLQTRSFQLNQLGIDEQQLQLDLQDHFNQIGTRPFIDYDLPLIDKQLLATCKRHAKGKWGRKSRLNEEQLVHKHLLRTRKT